MSVVVSDANILEEDRDQEVATFLLLSAFVMRKLMEDHRHLNMPLPEFRFPIATYPRINPHVEMNASNIGDLRLFFDFDHGYRETIEIGHLCNVLIHSLVLQPAIQDGAFHYVLVHGHRNHERFRCAGISGPAVTVLVTILGRHRSRLTV